MTRRSDRLQARSENVPIQKVKIAKQSNRKKTQVLSKRHNEKNQLALKGVTNHCILIETPEKGLDMVSDEYNRLSPSSRGAVVQPSPLPLLSWGSPEDVWEKMLAKEKKYIHSKSFMELHPRIKPRMRSILLNWLLEVSEVYTLHRQTFYLAQDYFDRFMMTQKDIDKDRLQLIGITSLFIAAKMEEIYPPKLSELAYVTDGACIESQILQMELVILKALSWELCPETAVSWLKLYVQMASLKVNSDVLHPQVPQEVYVQVTRLLDLCILSINSLDYEYHVLAAAVLCHFIPFETVEKVSGLPWDDLEPCVDWMSDFVVTVVDWGKVELKDFARVSSDERHNIQTHTDYIAMLDQARQRGEYENQFMTPPSSTEKLLTY